MTVNRAFTGILYRIGYIIPGGFVNNVPGIHIRVEVFAEGFAVGVNTLIDQFRRGGLIAVQIHPGGGLVMPDRRVRPDFNSHFPGQGDDGFRMIEIEMAFFRFGGLVLHFVFCGQAVELRLKQVTVAGNTKRRNRRPDLKVFFVGFGQRNDLTHGVSSLLMWHTRHRLRAGSYINIMIVKLT